MLNIKKGHVEVVDFLTKHKNMKVEDILQQVLEMCESKKKDSTIRKNDKNQITHVFCYYHKIWEDITECEYGSKSSSHSGLNTMCKLGVNRWTKQQSEFKKNKSSLLDLFSKG